MSLPKDTRRWPSPYVGQEYVLDDSEFKYGLNNWTWLHDSINGWYCPGGWETLPHGGDHHLTLHIKDGSKTSEIQCEANKRLNHVASVYDLEVWWGWGSWYGINGLAHVEFGFDQALSDGTRYFPFGYRWEHYPISAPITRTRYIKVADTPGGVLTYSNLPGNPVYEAGFNENKGDLNYFRGRFDFSATFSGGRPRYLGCIFGRYGFGCFDKGDGKNTVDWRGDGNAASLAVFAPPPAADVSFANGLNPSIIIHGRSDTTQNYAKLWVARARTLVIA